MTSSPSRQLTRRHALALAAAVALSGTGLAAHAPVSYTHLTLPTTPYV